MRKPKPTDPPEDALVAGWHALEPAGNIARKLQISNDCLYDCWSRLRRDGKVPSEQRPFVLEKRKNRGLTRQDQHSKPKPELDDGLPPGAPEDMRFEHACAELLELLRKAHGPQGRPDIQPGLRVRGSRI